MPGNTSEKYISGQYLVQLTDTHLFGTSSGRLMGADTNSSFLAVLDRIKAGEHLPDFIFVTGDLTQDDTLESYQWLKEQLTALNIPFAWTNGNHDHSDLMTQVCPEAMVKRVDLGDWQLILLNSQVAGEIPGCLREGELSLLDHYLTQFPEKHSIITFHHPAYKINSHWLDEISLQNPEAFLAIIARHNNVRVVINGHIHQEKEQVIQGVKFLSTPSTCVQFKPVSKDFMLDNCAPGYRELHLQPGGRFASRVVRLEDYRQDLDMAADGY